MLVPARSYPRSWPPSAVNLLVALGMAFWGGCVVYAFLSEPFLAGRHVPLSAWLATLHGLEQVPDLRQTLAWSASGLLQWKLWQPFTHLFFHSGLLHATVNLGLLWVAGRAIEPILGWRLLLALFLAAGVTGGMVELTFARDTAVLGSSAGVFGVAAAACVVWADYDLRSLRPFAWLPVSVRLRHVLAGVALTLAVALLVDSAGPLADVRQRAHRLGSLVGLGLGFLLARKLGFGRRVEARRPAPLPPPAIEMETELAEDPHEYIRDEIDPILDKIAARGMDSLTPGERRRLARASRMLR
ncbi:MAG: rhomboid family intramembrane serine protease [Verrucomicrobia bacterium]|nr:rhomboid family intramembrane serine protease [Verrucomicrobiota bacterium]